MNIVIVDDDKLVAQSLKIIVSASGVNVLEIGSDAEQAVELYFKHKPDILLMDIRMGAQTGLDAAERILSRDKAARILFLTTFADDEYIITALRIGARGYILKQSYDSIVPALLAVEQGQTVFGEEIVTRLPELMSAKKKESPELTELSDKEKDIITQVARGLSNKEISAALYLSEGTVRNYISVILEKLSLRDRTQLAIFYYKNMA